MNETQETKVETAEKPKLPLVRSITVDTFTAFQKNQIFDKWEEGKVTHDEWKDHGVDIVQFVRELREQGFILVGVLGYEGTGKSYGQKFLPSKTNIWFNVDNKDSTYRGGKAEYGTPESPSHYMVVPKTYKDVIDKIKKVKSKGMLAPRPIAFLIGHIEDYKSGDTTRQRLKTLGKISKINVEDMFTMCYYTEIIPDGSLPTYKLRTQNNGRNTGRTMEGQHKELYIDNNFAEIIKSFDEYE